ncbi:hypothetical protein BJV82DRAFT_653923 [Fennellomyces sp. T-0311]|nr:hypothetical protein BJV82DRAFT_653923 [Fennellomyces sp. T-0311]
MQANGQAQDLTQLVDGLSRQLYECFEKILADQTRDDQEESQTLDTQLVNLKSTVLDLERNLKQIRLDALGNRQLAAEESVELLKKDIELKKSTIEKYAKQLDQWNQELPVLEEKSRQVLKHRTDGRDFDEAVPNKFLQKKKQEEDDDDDEDAEFEEV